jgi:hypothetical protein
VRAWELVQCSAVQCSAVQCKKVVFGGELMRSSVVVSCSLLEADARGYFGNPV